MSVLSTRVAAVSPMLLSNRGLVAKKLILQRKFTGFTSVSSFTSSNQCFNSQYNKRLTFPTAMTNLVLDQGHVSYRQFVTKKTDPLQATPAPSATNLPQREQVERKVIKSYVVDDPAVQHYWKRFHEKMAESKKND